MHSAGGGRSFSPSAPSSLPPPPPPAAVPLSLHKARRAADSLEGRLRRANPRFVRLSVYPSLPYREQTRRETDRRDLGPARGVRY